MTSLQVMLIDDEPAIRQILSSYLNKAGYTVLQAENGSEALARLAKGDVDVALCDIKMPDFDGIEVVRRARASGIDTTFIMMTAFASVDTAIEAIKAGAADYMIKPLRNEEVLHRLAKAADMRGLRAENQVLRGLVQGKGDNRCNFVSPAMREIERLVAKVAPTESTVLITGESGTGKGVIARLIHQQSLRADEPFIPVNCGAIPENLMESELFGHIKGAFTGADKARKGLFLEADKGTIFLDEIGELPLQLQVKLLHVIEEKSVRPVGSEQTRKADVRIIAATNRDLKQLIAEGKFREDIYFRLGVFSLHISPLRERREDIVALMQFMLKRGLARLADGRRSVTVDPEVEEIFVNNDWPGNVRELENAIERALILSEGDRITLSDLPPQLTKVKAKGINNIALQTGGGSLREQVRIFEENVILRAIDEAAGDRRLAAQRLEIGLSSLYRKLEEAEASDLVLDHKYNRQQVRTDKKT